jgi:hypothetical protein
MRGPTRGVSIAMAAAACTMILGIAGDSLAAKSTLFDIKLNKPTILITHQNPSTGTCFGGTTEPCDVFQFTSKFSCTDCAQDLSNNFNIIFEVATSSNCSNSEYSAVMPLPNMSIQKAGAKTTYSFPATFLGNDGGRDFVLLILQMNGAHAGTITLNGNADLHAVTSAPVFIGLSLSGDSASDGDDPTDFVCVQVTPTFQNLN